MTHLIDKDALVAKIEKWRDGIKKGIFSIPLTSSDRAYSTFEYEILGNVKDYLDTLEVKEVNLEKEIKEEYLKYRRYDDKNNMLVILNELQFNKIAKYFFKLGFNAGKENKL